MRQKALEKLNPMLSTLLALVLCISMTPITAFAQPKDSPQPSAESTQSEPASENAAGEEAEPTEPTASEPTEPSKDEEAEPTEPTASEPTEPSKDEEAESTEPSTEASAETTTNAPADSATDEDTEESSASSVQQGADKALQPQVKSEDLVSTDLDKQEAKNESFAAYTQGDKGLTAALVGGKAAGSSAAAVQALMEQAELSNSEAQGVAATLFSGRSGLVAQSDMPSSGDGSNVDSITAKWVTADTVDNGDAALLYLKPSDDDEQSVLMQIDYSLSGEFDYNPGDVTISVPASIFADRDGNPYGTMYLPYPQAPASSAPWEWQLVGDNYVLTNTRLMSAASKGYMMFGIAGLTPDKIIDMQESDPFNATIEVTTNKGNTIGASSNDITAQIDSETKVTRADKRASGEASLVSAASIPENQRIPGEETYVVVNWHMSAWVEGNQPYTLTLTDTKGDEYEGFVVDATTEDGSSKDVTVFEGYREKESQYTKVRVAYPVSQFTVGNTYTFKNTVDYTLTERDPAVPGDEQLVTTASDSAETNWYYHKPVVAEPQGHFNLFKNGNDNVAYGIGNRQHLNYSTRSDISSKGSMNSSLYYGQYPRALNDIQNGDSVDLSYTIDTVGYLLPWTLAEGADYKVLDNYGKQSVTIITTDTGLYINCTSLQVGSDYTFNAVEFPIKPYIYKATALNLNPDGTIEFENAGDGTVTYSYDDDMSHIPDITLEIELNGSWQKWATASWSSGSLLVTLADGSTQTGTSVDLPQETSNFRTSVTAANAGVQYYMRPIVTMNPDGAIGALTDAAFENSFNPSMYVQNSTNLQASKTSDNSEIANINKSGADRVYGYTAETKAKADKTATQTLADYDVDKRQIIVHYSAQVNKQSYISDKVTYETALAEGEIFAENSGTWYDLLPKGMTPDIATIKLRDDDAIKDAYTIENYKGSGRTMLVVKADLTPVSTTYKLDSLEYYEDVLRITFDAYYGLDSYFDYGDTVHNVISFESDNDEFATVDGYQGEPDNPDAGNNVGSENAFDKQDPAEKQAMTDLDPTRDTPSFVYAGVQTNLQVVSAGQTSLSKDVSVNNDGYWSTGTWGNIRTVYEGGQYAYRLGVMSAVDTISKDLVLYDSLENFVAGAGNDPVDIDAPRWQGTFTGIDVSQLVAKGCDPLVYYSTVPNLNLQAPDGVNPSSNINLEDATIWSTTPPENLSDVKAIAIDARYSNRETQTSFELQPLDSIAAIISMQAPSAEEAAAGNAIEAVHAYNNSFLQATSVDKNTGIGTTDFVRKDYTKVGIEEFRLHVSKVWDDGDNRDGLRTPSAIVHLYADDADTGKTVTLNDENNWVGEFKDLPYTHDNGEKIHYSIKEDEVDNYQSTLSIDGLSYTITNVHKPELTQVSGQKTWENESSDTRPKSVKVNLLADGKVVQTKTVYPDNAGEWKYSFNDLFKYEAGHEIVYTIEEKDAGSYLPVVNGFDITNIYHPYGSLELGKTVVGGSLATESKDFTFTFVFQMGDNPIFDAFEYTTSDGRTGTVETDGSITLKAGQTATIQEIPDGVSYTITEQPEAGYTNTETRGDTGTIASNQITQSKFVNTYKAEASINLSATKKLMGQQLEYRKFRFELLDENNVAVRTAMSGKADPPEKDESGSIVSSQATALFGALHYTQADHGKTFTYTMREINSGLPGYQYEENTYTAIVKPIDNGDGTMSVDVSYADEQGNPVAAPLFTNEYKAEGSITPKFYKQLNGRDLSAGEFKFDLGLVTVTGDSSQFTALQTDKTNDATGVIAFDEIKYSQADIGKTFLYAVYEKAGADSTVVYDGHYELFAVTVSDNGDGTLSTATTTTDLSCPCFVCAGNDENCPVCAGSGMITSSDDPYVFKNGLHDGGLDITKIIEQPSEGADPNQLFKFRVELSNANGEPVDIDTEKVITEKKTSTEKKASAVNLSENKAEDKVATQAKEPENSFDLLATAGDAFKALFGVEKAYAAEIAETTTNGGCTLTLYDDGSLTVSPSDGVSGQLASGTLWNAQKTTIKSITIEEGVSLNANSANFLSGYSKLTSVTFPDNFDTSNVTDMRNVFNNCKALTELDVSGFNTDNVKDMSSMFAACEVLTELNVSGFNTSKVTTMANMFSNCKALTELNVSSFNTSKVKDMSYMFNNCAALTELDISNFDTSVTTNMRSMFQGTTSLKEITLGSAFSFKGKNIALVANQALLSTPPAVGTTGKWIIADKSKPSVLATDLRDNYPSDSAGAYPVGTYVWEVDAYTITFNANTGSGSMAQQTCSASTSETIIPNTFTKPGFSFIGWSATADGPVIYDNRGTIPAGSYAVNSSVTLYAQWEEVKLINKIEDGVYEITMPGDSVVHLSDSLPAGTTYRVYEETPAGWVLASSSDTIGTIAPKETAHATFTNIYMPGTASVQLRATKTLDGLPATADSGFIFQLLVNNAVLQVKRVADGGAVLFDPIVYDAAGVHTYTIREVVVGNSNYTYDTHEETVIVTVKDDGAGNMSSTVKYDTNGAAFSNTTNQSALGELTLTKATVGTTASNPEFSFKVTFVDKGAVTTQEVKLKGGETKTFEDLQPGTTYTIAETDIPAGWTQTGVVNTEGSIVAGETAAATVTNTYEASGTADIWAYKSFEGGVLSSGQFTFNLMDSDADNATVLATGTNGEVDTQESIIDAGGNLVPNPHKGMAAIGFETLKFTAPGEYIYYLREQVPAQREPGVVYDPSVKKVTVKVTDDGKGKLTTAVEYEGGSDAVFVNRMTDSGVLEVAKKTLNRTEAATRVDTSFSFTVTLKDAAGNDLSNLYDATIYNADNTPARLMQISNGTKFELKAGQYLKAETLPFGTRYELTETATTDTGWTQTGAVGASGTLGAEPAFAEFENTYAAKGQAVFTATKKFDDVLAEGQFEFSLKDETGTVLQTVTNAADGSVTFNSIEYTDADSGKTFSYTLSEIEGDTQKATYDPQVYTVTVTPNDNGSGVVNCDVVYKNEQGDTVNNPEFGNTRLTLLAKTGGRGVSLLGLGVLACGLVLYSRRRWNYKQKATKLVD